MGDRRDPTIQSVDRAARILKALGAGSPRLGVSELAERLGLAKTTVHGLLRTLERQDLAEQDPETGKYRLGPEMLQLGNAFLDHHELRGRSLVWADTLAERVGEAVRVGVLYGRRVLVVHHVFRPDDSVQILEVGASVPWHASALGKVHAAFLPSDRRRTLVSGPLQRLTGRTIVDPHALALALDDVADGAESVLELRYVNGVERSHGLPAATRQQRSTRAGRRWRDDNAYEQQRVLVELDGRLGHVGEGAFRDRSRDNGALLDGWVTLRFGWQDVTQRPCLVAADVAKVLRDRGWSGRARRCGRQCRLDATA